MAYRIEWLVEGRIALTYLSGLITLEETLTFDRDILPYLEQAQPPLVHLLFDTSALEQLPGITTLNKFQWPKHPRVGWVISYPQPNPLIAFLTYLMAQIFKSRNRTMNTLEESLAFLNDVDATLPDLAEARAR
jgi:hypothetical protein